jgi:peptidylprolyl isomerase
MSSSRARLARLAAGALLAGLLAVACTSAGSGAGALPTPDPRLKIEQLAAGSGEPARPGDVVLVNYTGWFEDGTKFDSSLDQGEPIQLALGAGMVIPGWEQGLIGMRMGERRRLTIPPELAYGASGAGGVIPPNATLIFELDLLAIKPGVKVEELAAGSGTAADYGDVLSVHYTGWLEDGTQFDSSRERDEPFRFQLAGGQVIEGWDVGLRGLRVGGKRRLTIPPYLAYGDQGAGEVIPPNATLIFEIELLEVTKR